MKIKEFEDMTPAEQKKVYEHFDFAMPWIDRIIHRELLEHHLDATYENVKREAESVVFHFFCPFNPTLEEMPSFYPPKELVGYVASGVWNDFNDPVGGEQQFLEYLWDLKSAETAHDF